MNNGEPLQIINGVTYVYGTPINGDTGVVFPDGKWYRVTRVNDDKITYAPITNIFGVGQDNNQRQTLTASELQSKFATYTSGSKYADQKAPEIYGVGTQAIEKRDDGRYYVYGKQIDLNGETRVKLPDGKTYAVLDIEDGNIKVAPTYGLWDGAVVDKEKAQTLKFEDFDKKYYPVGKNSAGEVTYNGRAVSEGSIIIDPVKEKTYLVTGVDGKTGEIKASQVEIDNGKIKKVSGTSVSLNQYGVDPDSKAASTQSLNGGAANNGGSAPSNTSGLPSNTPGAPADDPNTPPVGPNTPADDPNTPPVVPNTPADDPNKPADDPDKPADDPDKPADGPDKPADDPDKPINGTEEDSTIVDENSNKPVVTTPEKINEMSSRADNYEEVRTLENDYYHGYGARDKGDVGDQDKALVDFDATFHDEKVQAKFNEINGGSPTIHAGEGISHHHHQTMVDDYQYNGKDVTYLPGQLIELAGDPTKISDVEPFKEIYQGNKDKNILGDGFKPKQGEKWSKIEYAAALASSGKYSMQDVFGTADALGDDNFGFYEGPYFQGTQFAAWAKENEGKDYEEMEKELTNDVADLIKGWQDVHQLLDEMSGSAKDATEFYTAQCIQGKFEIAMGNINERLKPACLAINMLLFNSDVSSIKGAEGVKIPTKEWKTLSNVPGVTAGTPLMKQLELGEEALNNMLGTGPDPIKDNRKQLLEDIDDAQTKLNGWQQEKARHGSCPSATYDETTDADGNVTKKQNNGPAIEAWKNRNNEIEGYIKQWKDKLEELGKKFDELEELIKALRTELNAILEYSMILLDFIKKYDTFRTTFRGYVLPGADGKNTDIYNWVHSGNIADLVNNHDAIIHGFEDYDKMPVISNKSDYNRGDVVLYDDAHGYIYVVKGYDPLTGELIIACYDRNGNQVGSDIKVMDQREITPIGGIKPISEEYGSIPETFLIDETVPDTEIPTTKPKIIIPGTNPQPTIPETKPIPDNTIPETKPIPDNTIPETRPVPETTVPPEITPTVIIETTPPPPVPPTPGPTPTPSGPYSPHTGLDAIYGTGETKQSAAGLGALAGLAAGAAGLGLTGLIGDKKDEEEEEEEDSTLQMTEEEKPAEEENKETQEKTEEDNTSNPQFF